MNTPTKTPINTSERLFDLVRYMRAELYKEELIDDEEYGWLCAGPMAVSPKGGSPSCQRLEEYDEMKARIIALETAAQGLRDASELIMDVKHCMMFLRIHDEQTAKEVCERHQVENVQLLAKKAQDVAEEALARFDALKEGK